MDGKIDNINPQTFETCEERVKTEDDYNDNVTDEFDAREVFDMLRHINDPEHPLTLEQLRVVELENVEVKDDENYVRVTFTPTIPHCSMATLIGLSLRVQLLRCLPRRFKVDVVVREGSHVSELAINKQLADKERVAAALENGQLLGVVNKCLAIPHIMTVTNG